MAIIDCKSKKLTKAGLFFAEKLGLDDSVFIHIKIKKKLKHMAGYCEHLADSSDFLKVFLIVLDKSEDQIDTLAHEMVHVKQYAKGELADVASAVLWRGERLPMVKVSSEEYYFAPWEVEAVGLGYGLTQLYRRDK